MIFFFAANDGTNLSERYQCVKRRINLIGILRMLVEY
jgi:hypothetical protein